MQSPRDRFPEVQRCRAGGIIALGLGAGLTAAELRDLYVDRGGEIFPSAGNGLIGRLRGAWRAARQYGRYIYDQDLLATVLRETLGDRKFGSSTRRLCVPSFDGEHGEVYIFKTPHHPDFTTDWRETMVKVALATSAAPTYYRPFRDAGYIFVDGGVWANNPITIALVEALASIEVTREQIRILSIGCGETAFTVQASQVARSGLVQWRNIISAAMRLQSQNALGHAGLVIGPEQLIRIDLPQNFPAIELDDWATAVERLPGEAARAVEISGQSISEGFLYGRRTLFAGGRNGRIVKVLQASLQCRAHHAGSDRSLVGVTRRARRKIGYGGINLSFERAGPAPC